MSIDNTHGTPLADENVFRIQEDLDYLQTAAADLARSRTIDTEERVEAIERATHLAETLTVSESAEAAAQAREVLATLQQPGLPQPERLEEQVSALRETLSAFLQE